MLLQLIGVTLRTLAFRSGPQDFPYGSEVLRASVVAAIAMMTLLFALVLPLSVSLIMAAASIAGISAFTRALLRARSMESRWTQTLSALLLAGFAHGLFMLPLMAQLAPELLRVLGSPELLERMRAGQQVDLAVAPLVPLLLDAIVLWNLLVTAHIYRNAIDVRFGIGMLITLLAAFMVLFIVMLSASFAALLFGAGA